MVNEEEKRELDEKIEKLKNSKFKQQMLPAWRPVPSFASTMITFGIFGVVFLAIGIMLYVMSDKIQEIELLYGPNVAGCPMVPTDSEEVAEPCVMAIEVTEVMQQPIFVYYQLENFYQNHRRYVKSRDYKQLMGYTEGDESWAAPDKEDVSSSCAPIILNSDLANMGIKYYAWEDLPGEDAFGYDEFTPLDPDGVAVPCGLIAKSLFNDTYALYADEALAEPLRINQADIAWKSDVTYKFGNYKDWKQTPTQWMDMKDEHFIVWMRTAGLPNFRKLWGKIEENLEEGTYYVDIENNYNVDDFSGTKAFVLSTTNMLGGRNYFLAVCYIVVGALCIVFAVIFFVAYMRKRSYQNNNAPHA